MTKEDVGLIRLKVKLSSSEVRQIEYNGSPTTVVPAVILVEGVHHGVGSFPLFYSEEVLKKYAPCWNGVPITVRHPKNESGDYTLCNSPEILEKACVGRVFNSRQEDKKTKVDLYINNSELEAQAPSFINEVLNSENDGEVSTGIIALINENEGNWNGEDYGGEVIEIMADHLALLPDEKGACSTKDGCGLLKNKSGEEESKVVKIGKLIYIGNEDSLFEKVNLLEQALRAETKVNTSRWLVDVYDDYLIYEEWKDDKSTFYKLGYSIKESSEVSFIDDPIEVKVKKNYVEVKNEEEVKNTMCCVERVKALIENEATPYSDSDKDWLIGLNEEAFSKIEETAYKEPTVDNNDEEDTEGTNVNNEGAQNEMKKVGIEDLEPEIQKMVKIGLKEHNDKKEGYISALLANENNRFTKEVLEAKDIEELEMLVTLASGSNTNDSSNGEGSFVLRGGGPTYNAEEHKVEPMSAPTMEDYNK